MADASTPALIGLDWGTSSLRAFLFGADGTLLDRRCTGHGIQHLPAGGYAAAFLAVAKEWLDRVPGLPVIAAGMVGSRNGWREVPYVPCPASPVAIAAGLVAFDTGHGVIHLVPGLSQSGPFPDVMRGEEVQILGGLLHDPMLAERSLFVLPGTHCKWADVEAGRVTKFTTYLTGELFELLREHSLLGRPAKESSPAGLAQALDHHTFVNGVAVARAGGASGVMPRLFSTRSLFLSGELTPLQTLEYLSGLLIGEEIRSVLARLNNAACPPVVLLGDPALCARYQLALDTFGIPHVHCLNETGPLGIWQIAQAAGIVSTPNNTQRRGTIHG